MTHLSLDEFDFSLPDHLIAQKPAEKRDESRLLHYQIKTKTIEDHSFLTFPNCIPKNAVLVLNNTKVIKARVIATRSSGAKIECFFIEKIKPGYWEILIKNAKRVQINEFLIVDHSHTIQILNKTGKYAKVKIIGPSIDLSFLEQFGNMPLPQIGRAHV